MLEVTPGPMPIRTDETPLVAPGAALSVVAERMLGGPLTALTRLTGGASQEIWSFEAGGARYVLRRSPGGGLFDKMATVGLETEAAAIRAVERESVPVAPVIYVLEAGDGLGQGFISRHIKGEALGQRIVRGEGFAALRPRLARAFGEVLAAIHATPLGALPSLVERSPADGLDQLETQLRSFNRPHPAFEAGLAWLRDRCPADHFVRFVHGDFRVGNMLITPDGIQAVLDWEVCHLGDPMEDLGWLCMPSWRFGRLDLPVGGVGLREDLFAAYERVSGMPVDTARVRFWEVRGMLRWGLTCMAMAEAFTGGDRGIERAAVGRRASEAESALLDVMAAGG